MKRFTLIILFLLFKLITSAQNISKVFDKEEPLTYFGLDFYKAKLIGNFGSTPIVLIPQWNYNVASNQKRFDIQGSFNKKVIKYDMDPVVVRNDSIKKNKLMGYNNALLTDEEIQQEINVLPVGEMKNGMGVIFLVDYINKNEGISAVNITFFDIATKHIYFSQIMEGEPGGVSLQNYFIKAIEDILIQIKGGEFNKWKRNYTDK